MPPDDVHRGPDRDLAAADLCRLAAICHYEPEPAFAEEGVFRAMNPQLTARVLLGMFASFVLFQEILGLKKTQLYDREGKPLSAKGHADGLPVWSLPTAFAGPDGNFTIIY